jgi:DNA-binding LacI/PurR family transcriptional regulator
MATVRRVAEPAPGDGDRPERPAPFLEFVAAPRVSGVRRGSSIYDVAKAAGVAPSTVSRAFSRPGRVNAGTAERIFAAARGVGYRSGVLHGPTGPRTRTLAVVASDITNPFYGEIVRGAHEAAGESGFTILLSHAREDAPFERDWTERELNAVEGVLLTSSRMSHNAIRMLAKEKPLVLLNRRVPEVPAVVTDNARGMRRAVEHLAELGHQSVTYVAGPEASWADGTRWVALMEACNELDLRFRRVGPCKVPTVPAGLAIASEVLAQRATAIIAYNDLMAIGVIKGMRRAGVRVPHDINVVGFDNIALSAIVDPGLTTVAAPLRAMGIIGVENLIATIGGATPSRDPLVLPAKLLVRGSTGPRRRNGISPVLPTTRVSGSFSKTVPSTVTRSR